MEANHELFYTKLDAYERALKDEYEHDPALLQLIGQVQLKSQFYFKPVNGLLTLTFFKDSQIPPTIQEEVSLLYRLTMIK